MPDKKTFLKLFTSTLTLSAFTFGGGYVMIPLMKRIFSEKLGWIQEDEMLELTAIGQSAPGALAINTAVLVGYRVAGLPGALVSMLGTALPPLVILSVLCLVYDYIRDNVFVAAAMRGMQAGITAVIADVVFSLAKPFLKRKKLASLALMLAAFAAAWFWSVNAAIIIAACGILGAVAGLVLNAREKHRRAK